MDEKDLLLLRLLEENSRLSPDELAIMAELSGEDVRCRIAALEEAKIIRSYTTIIDWERAA
ncbi:MAG TPA: AsnC family transcriptional regulator, partial [Methanoregulaceae archaeon]|nr:AsnC family transcriptional regulator [Methanoregulaceae archaeon]